MISKEKFRACFKEDLSQKIKVENFKLVFCKTAMVFFTLLAVSFLIWGGVVAINGNAVVENMLFVPIVAIGSVAITFAFLIAYYDLKKNIKKKILQPILAKIFEGDKYLYEESRHIGKNDVVGSKFIQDKNFELTGEDYLEITMTSEGEETTVKVSDIFASTVESLNNKEGVSKIIDSGIFGVVDYGREVKCGIIGNFRLPDFEKMELESVDFNDLFECYTDNQIESRKILTPRLMAKLLKLQQGVNKEIRFNLSGNHLYFLVQKNLFKYKLRGKIGFEEVEQIYDQVYIIYEVAKEIAKNKKIFK